MALWGVIKTVTSVTAAAMGSNFAPRRILERLSWEEMPEIVINTMGTMGENGLKNKKAAAPACIW